MYIYYFFKCLGLFRSFRPLFGAGRFAFWWDFGLSRPPLDPPDDFIQLLSHDTNPFY